MNKFLIVLCLALALGLGGCSTGAKAPLLGGSGVGALVDYQTDVPMLAYAFCKIKPGAAAKLLKLCEAAAIVEDREALLALLEEHLANYSGLLATDDFTRQWIISKAQALAGITISRVDLRISSVDEAVSASHIKMILGLICEGARAHRESL